MTDIRPQAVKIGMINDVKIVEVIAGALQKFRPRFVVFDPVMVSTSGCKLIEDEAIEALTTRLMPLATLITPNLSEAQVLTGIRVNGQESMQAAAHELLKLGSRAVLIKGGHLDGGRMYDLLQVKDEPEPHLFSADKVESNNTHGTGCTLSSAIATRLALGRFPGRCGRQSQRICLAGYSDGKRGAHRRRTRPAESLPFPGGNAHFYRK